MTVADRQRIIDAVAYFDLWIPQLVRAVFREDLAGFEASIDPTDRQQFALHRDSILKFASSQAPAWLAKAGSLKQLFFEIELRRRHWYNRWEKYPELAQRFGATLNPVRVLLDIPVKSRLVPNFLLTCPRWAWIAGGVMIPFVAGAMVGAVIEKVTQDSIWVDKPGEQVNNAESAGQDAAESSKPNRAAQRLEPREPSVTPLRTEKPDLIFTKPKAEAVGNLDQLHVPGFYSAFESVIVRPTNVTGWTGIRLENVNPAVSNPDNEDEDCCGTGLSWAPSGLNFKGTRPCGTIPVGMQSVRALGNVGAALKVTEFRNFDIERHTPYGMLSSEEVLDHGIERTGSYVIGPDWLTLGDGRGAGSVSVPSGLDVSKAFVIWLRMQPGIRAGSLCLTAEIGGTCKWEVFGDGTVSCAIGAGTQITLPQPIPGFKSGVPCVIGLVHDNQGRVYLLSGPPENCKVVCGVSVKDEIKVGSDSRLMLTGWEGTRVRESLVSTISKSVIDKVVSADGF